MVSKASRLPTTSDALLNNRRNTKDLYGLNRLRNTTRTIQPPANSGVPSQGSSAGSSGTGLRTAGDSMIGAIAFFPVDADIVDDAIDIGPSGNSPSDFSTYVRLLPEGGVDDDLKTIFNASFAGQLLYLQGAQNLVVSIIEGSAVNGGNILTNGAELFLIGDQFLELLFDPQADTGDPNVQGAWRVIGGGTGGFSSLLAGLSSTVNPNLPAVGTFVIPWNENFILGQDKIQATATAGVFRLEDGIFDMSSTVSLEGDETGSGTNILMAWQEADLETGPWTGIPEPNARAGVYQIGRPSLSTQPHAVVIRDYSGVVKFVRLILNVQLGTLVNVFDATSFAQISTGGTGSGGGGGGSTTLAGLTDVILTNPVNTEVLTYNGNEWVNLPSAGGAMNTDLSNMIEPTLPNVNLGMNGFGIQLCDFLDLDGQGFIQGIKNLTFFQTNQFLFSVSGGLLWEIPSLQSYEFRIGNTPVTVAKFEEPQNGNRFLNMSGNAITAVDSLIFSDTQTQQQLNAFSIGKISGAGRFNVDTGDAFVFQEFGSTIASFGKFLAVGYTLNDTVGIILEDSGNDIVQNGFIMRNGSNVLIGSGGKTVNISDVNTNENRIFQDNTSVEIIDTGLGTITSNVDGSVKSILSATGLDMQTRINMGGNTIAGIAFLDPSGNHIRDIGDATGFWRETFTDKITLERTSNSITGDSGGINYFSISTGQHEWLTGATIRMQLDQNELRLLNGVTLDMANGGGMSSDIDMNGNTIFAVDDLEFSGATSALRMFGGQIFMNNGDIREVDDLFMRSDGGGIIDMGRGDINDIDDLNFRTDGGGTIFLNGGEIAVGSLSSIQSIVMAGNTTSISNLDSLSFFDTSSLLDMNAGDIDMGGGELLSVSEINMTGASASIRMNAAQLFMGNGDIREVDDLAMRSGGGGIIDMNGGIIDEVTFMGFDEEHNMKFSDSVVEIEVNGAGDIFGIFDGSPAARITYDFSTDDFFPLDLTSNLGRSNKRWLEVFALNGTINTSFSEFKKNINPTSDENCADICTALEPIKFNWKDGSFDGVRDPIRRAKYEGQTMFGYNADALKALLPEAVTGEPGEQGIYEQAVIGLLIGTVRHLKARIEKLENP